MSMTKSLSGAVNDTASDPVMALSVNTMKLFTLVGGICPVKNPLYIARRFSGKM